MQISAAVVQEVGAPFVLTDVELQEPAPDEVVVQIAGAGICHTDIAVQHGHLPFPLPGVLGHEGSGTVVSAGSDVTTVAVGDQVAISFNSCAGCPQCAKGQPAYCHGFLEYNFGGARPDGSSGLSSAGTKLGSNFFGQSSLATHALAHERNVVKLPPGAPVELVGPLGCGIQTGAGAVLNALRVPPGRSIAIFGTGAVGLSAVMAARLAGASTIIAVDRLQSRLSLAMELGATHAVNPNTEDAREAVLRITRHGADFSIDTTTATPVIRQAIQCLAPLGTCAVMASESPQQEVPFNVIHLMSGGRTIRGIVEGDSKLDRTETCSKVSADL